MKTIKYMWRCWVLRKVLIKRMEKSHQYMDFSKGSPEMRIFAKRFSQTIIYLQTGKDLTNGTP